MQQPYPLFNPDKSEELLRGWLLHAHKVRDRHDFAARRCDTLRSIFGAIAVGVPAVAGASVFATLEHDESFGGRAVFAILSVAASVLTALWTFFDYPARAERHRGAAGKSKEIIHELEQRLTPEAAPGSLDSKLIDELRERVNGLERDVPVVPQRIFNRVEARYRSFRFAPSAQDLAPGDDGPSCWCRILRRCCAGAKG